MEPFFPVDEVNSAKAPSLFLLSKWMKQNNRLTAGFSGREGGVSDAPWKSLNIGLHVEDSHENVVANRRSLTDAINWPFEAWTCGEQVHGNRVAQVTPKDRGKGREMLSDSLAGVDALMTNVPDVLLTSFYADCVPLYFYAPDAGAVALAHAGWRGTVGEIARETVEAMKAEYGVKPDELIAAIGPSIDSCCYEVDGMVIGEVAGVLAKLGLEQSSKQLCLQPKENGKAYLNLKEINRQIMIKAGILPSRIELSNWCTGCRRDLFFSHRMEGGRTGRMASWIGIRER